MCVHKVKGAAPQRLVRAAPQAQVVATSVHDLACDATPSETVDLHLDEHTKMRYAGFGPHVGDMQNSQAPCPCSHFLRQNSNATKSQIRCGSTRAPDRKPSTARFKATGSTKPEPHKESRLKRSRT